MSLLNVNLYWVNWKEFYKKNVHYSKFAWEMTSLNINGCLICGLASVMLQCHSFYNNFYQKNVFIQQKL
jgi:hypothetical protein